MKRDKVLSFVYRIWNHKILRIVLNKKFKLQFSSSESYWEKRYAKNGNSGNGSYGNNAIYKARILNNFVSDHKIKTVIELGCGDGNQLKLFNFPFYIGYDISETAIAKCKSLFDTDATKTFYVYNKEGLNTNSHVNQAELVLSLDVIYHLLEDDVYENYMAKLFSYSLEYLIIYAWDVEEKQTSHVRHRKFSVWIKRNKKDWQLIKIIKNNAAPTCDFFIYKKL